MRFFVVTAFAPGPWGAPQRVRERIGASLRLPLPFAPARPTSRVFCCVGLERTVGCGDMATMGVVFRVADAARAPGARAYAGPRRARHCVGASSALCGLRIH